MPELPEVETTRRGVQPHVTGQTIERILLSGKKLRYPFGGDIQQLIGQHINRLERRAKYLIFNTDAGHLIWHLGMSGSLRIQPVDAPSVEHEHVRIDFTNGASLRYRDPRRFGFVMFESGDPHAHKLISTLGPEPLSQDFNASYLKKQCQSRTGPIKNVIMDSHVVVGVGNIYACESLFDSAINPKTRASRIGPERLQRLVSSIKSILARAIEQGGTTLQDFTQADGKPGYFRQSLKVYGNTGACPVCARPVKRIILGQRSTWYCPACQK